MAACLDRAPVAGVDRLPGVGGADDATDLDVVVQEDTNSLQAFSQDRMIAGYCSPHFAVNSTKRSLAAASVAAV